MKKQLPSQKRLTRFFCGLCILLSINLGWGQQQQVIGTFPTMDGGMEGQTVGPVSINIVSGTAWTATNTSTAGNALKNIYDTSLGSPRSGSKYAIFTASTTAGSRFTSPTVTTLAASTQYTVQYYARAGAAPSPAVGGALYTSASSINVSATPTSTWANATDWYKVNVTITSTTSVPTYGAVRKSGGSPTTEDISIDDFVIYAGALDTTAPTSPTALTVSGLGVSWTAPAGGVDGGGYVVVRYASNPNLDNDPNPNGIYASGNTITNGTGPLTGTVVYVGTATSFTDAVAGSVSGSDYYKVYAVDKAFNYSDEITAKMDTNAAVLSATPATLTGFNYILGSGPSTAQSFVVGGSNLTADIGVTPSTNYEVSADGTTFQSTILTVTTGSTVYTRLKAGLSNGSYAESLQLSSTGATNLPVSCSGSVSGTYYFNGSGTLSTLTNWGANTDGTGTNPSSLTSANATFVIKNTAAVSTDAAWTLGSGSKIIVGDVSSPAVTLTIVSGSGITGTVDITAASSGSNSVVCQNATIPTFGTLDSTSEVHLQFTSTNALALTATFGKLFFDATSNISVGSAGTNYIKAIIQSSLTIASGGFVNFSNGSNSYFYFNTGATATVNGTLKTSKPAGIVGFSVGVAPLTADSNSSPALQFSDAENVGVNLVLTGSTIEFSRGGSTTPQVVAPRTDYNNVVFSDFTSAGIKSFSGNITVSGTLTMNHAFGTTFTTGTGSGSITMGNGASIVRTSGDFVGLTFNFGSTVNVTYNGTVAITTGNEIPTLASVLNDLTINNAGGVTLATDSTVNNNLTITAGTLTVPTGKNLTVVNSIANNGTITVENNANLVQTSVSNSNTGTGNAIVKRNSNPLYRLDYTMWSSPVVGQQLLAFSPATTSTRFYTYNSSLDEYAAVDPSTPFVAGLGNLIRMPNTDPKTDYDAGTATLEYPGVFTGVLNNGDVPLNGLTASKYYAVGNPYPSTINADDFFTDNPTAGGTMYFWRKTNNLDQTNNPTTSYATYTSAGGVGTGPGSGGIIPNGIIQVGQGFIVNSGAATSLVFNNGMRVANNVGQILKTKKVVDKDRIWLNMTNTSGTFSQALVAYMDGATLGVDNAIDGLYFNDSPVALTSNINGGEYTIQGRPTFDVTDVVALNFKTDVAGDYTIGIDHVDGLFASGQDVYLVDTKTGTETNLKSGSYTFAATAGTDNARFSLKYQKTLKVNPSVFSDTSVTVYRNNGTLFVNSGASAINNIKVFDIQGRLIVEQKNVKANTASISNLKATHQALIVKVTSEDNKVVNKKVLY